MSILKDHEKLFLAYLAEHGPDQVGVLDSEEKMAAAYAKLISPALSKKGGCYD